MVIKRRIRGGGRPTPGGYLFELTGGRLCLDFANTLDCRPTDRPRELLTDYRRLVSWAEQAGALQPLLARRLRQVASRRPGDAARVLETARTLREAIFSLCAALASGHSPDPQALQVLNGALSRALSRRRLGVMRGGIVWEWTDADAPLDRMLWPVARSSGELLSRAKDRQRLRLCAAENCAWLFLDRSRNRSRRWCDMSVCGNRAKARRHYRRQRSRTRD